ncbi:MAG: high frequency lysogenization protein HflD [Gammaproteobacteria bacterium]|nr:high frequency lysogenization protein HflD [Gammaproteobacteria bacterium]
MSNTLADRTLALGGIFQAALLVQELARRGRVDAAPMQASIKSVLVIDAIDTRSVFGGVDGVKFGLMAVRDRLGRRIDADDLELARYVLGLSRLQRQMRREPGRLKALGSRLQAIRGAATEVGPDLYRDLASIYTELISEVAPRIMVHGEQGFLSDAAIVDQVRSTLLAGVRAAYLWDQLGGRQWQLLLQRVAYVRSATLWLHE